MTQLFCQVFESLPESLQEPLSIRTPIEDCGFELKSSGVPIAIHGFRPPFHPHETHIKTKVLDRGAYRYLQHISIRTPIQDFCFHVRFMRVKWGVKRTILDRGHRAPDKRHDDPKHSGYPCGALSGTSLFFAIRTL